MSYEAFVNKVKRMWEQRLGLMLAKALSYSNQEAIRKAYVDGYKAGYWDSVMDVIDKEDTFKVESLHS